jgi:osmotically-inducible protein OsmY
MGARHRWDPRLRRREPLTDSSLQGWDDPVPSNSTVIASSLTDTTRGHDLECEVQRRLLEQPGLRFTSLVIRRLDDGVCIQGVLETDSDAPDLIGLAKQVAGVERVIDQVVIHQAAASPCC